MVALNLTIQVLDLSPKVTLTDLNIFFSYCGTVDKILMERKEDQSLVAFVFFRQHYALQTALLLNGAIIVDSRVRILPLVASPAVSDIINYVNKKNEKPVRYEALNMAKENLDEKNLSEKGRVVTIETRLPISTAEQTAGCFAEMIMGNQHFSAGAFWVSGTLDNAAKWATELGTHNRRRGTFNSRN